MSPISFFPARWIRCLRSGLSLLGCLAVLAAPAWAASTSVVISQVYGGGGNSGATYTNDFIELHNVSNAAVSVAGWAVQYNSATGTGAWQVTPLSGSIPAGGYYLVQEGAGTGGTTALPTPQATGAINMSGSTGRVALTTNTTALAVANPSGGVVVDLLGFGPTVIGFEGAPTAVLSNTTSASRLNSGSTDTDNNVSDFTLGTVAPRNASTAPFIPTPSATPTPTPTPTPIPSAVLSATVSAGTDHLLNGQTVVFTVTVSPATSPASTGLTVVGDFTALSGSPTQVLTAGAGNTFTFSTTVPSNLTFGTKTLTFTAQDAQARSATVSLNLALRGNLTILHTNDTHARVTPHEWIVPEHKTGTNVQFEAVGGAAYMGGKILSLVAAQPDALVLDGGDISEGNPIGDWNGPPAAVGSFGNATIVDYYKLLDTKLKVIPARGGRGLDAMVVGNHDIRDMSYVNNMKAAALANFPILSINLCVKGTKTPYFAPYTIVNVNGNKIGILGYTTESADSADPAVTAALDVVKCDWASSDATKIHFSDYVNELRNTHGCTMVILLTHMGHSGLCTVTGANPTPILVDNAVAKVPEIVISGHWHTFAETVWQPTSLNYKTIFTEAGSFMHYVGELRVDGDGKYVSNANYPLRNSQIVPDPDIAAMVQAKKDAYAATNPTYGVDQVIGYTADALLLDNYMKWWTSDEYPWSGDNTAGAWICDSMVWKCNSLFPATPCDLAIEAGGGVRSDIPAGPITYSQIYETFPWADDTLYLMKMTGQQIWNYIKDHGCNAAVSRGWFITAFDGVPTSITYNGVPINLSQQYNVAINNYMYTHDSSNLDQIDTAPQTSTYLARTALIEYAGTFPQSAPYTNGGPRYGMNTEFSGGYRAVVTLISDNNSRPTFDSAFIRFLSATPETLAHRGTPQVPTSLVNADGSVNPANRLAENQLYRSYLGFRTGVLHPGDIIETWGKGAFFEGNPEFVDQEGIKSNGVEFKIVGHDDSLAKPVFVPDLAVALDDFHKNHYMKVVVKKTGTNTAVDRNGTTLTVWNVDAFTKKTLPGNVNDFLVLTGVPSSESFSMRLRCDNAVLASTQGITGFPALAAVTSTVSPVPASTTASPITLSAVATSTANGVYSLAPVADAQVSSGNPTVNYGASNNLFVQSSTVAASSFGNEYSWARFDLSGLPAGATIAQAELQLYCWGAGTSALNVKVESGANDTWTETGLNWNNQPAVLGTLATQTLAAGSTNLYYSWDVTPFAQTKLAGNKLVSLVAKPAVDDSATALTYKFDAKEFGSGAPILKVTTVAGGAAATVAQVEFFYRYSADNISWGAWTSTGIDATAAYSAPFAFPQGYGYYEFYSVATDSNGAPEATPSAAQASTHYSATPPYNTEAIVTLGNLTQTFDGFQHAATVTVIPSIVPATVTYNGSSTPPTHAGSYTVSANVSTPGYTGSATGTLVISKAAQTITFGALPAKAVGDAPFALNGVSSSGLPVTYSSNNGTVASVSGNTVTVGTAGTATITAFQLGDADHLSATPVAQTLTVGVGAVTGEDVPVLPPWALFALGGSLFAAATRMLKGRRHNQG